MTDKTPNLNNPGDDCFNWTALDTRSSVPPYGTVDISAISTGNPDPKLHQGAVGCDFPPIDEHLVRSTTTSRWVSGSAIPQQIPRTATEHTSPDPYAKHSVAYGLHPEDWRATGPTFVTKPIATNTAPASCDFAVRHDGDKTDWSLMPWECVEEINKVLDFGAKKYSANNWKAGNGFSWTRVLSSMLRHTFAWSRGEDLDPESGLSHLAHMGANVLFLLYYTRHKARYSRDDRASS